MKSTLYSLLSLLLLSSMVFQTSSCGSTLPIRELSDARKEIAMAQSERADVIAPETYQKSQDELMEAHKTLDGEDNDATLTHAQNSLNQAILTREKTAPQHTEYWRQKAEASLKEADRVFATRLAQEEMSDAQDAFNSALEKHNEANDKRAELYASTENQNSGNESAETAESSDNTSSDENAQTAEESEGNEDNSQEASSGDSQQQPTDNIPAEDKLDLFERYRDSYQEYQKADMLAQNSVKLALSRKDDLLYEVEQIESQLDRSAAYDESETGSEDFQNARQHLAGARRMIDTSDLRDANQEIESARTLAGNIYARSAKKYSDEHTKIAERKLNDSRLNVNAFAKQEKDNEDENVKDQVKTLGDYVSAGDEALQSSKSNYQNDRYEDSIKDADEVIRLTEIIDEKLKEAGLVAFRSTKRSTTSSSDTASDSKSSQAGNQTDMSGHNPVPGGVFVVQPGNSLSKISREVYKVVKYWTAIFDSNRDQIKNPDLIYPGQKLKLPKDPKSKKLKK